MPSDHWTELERLYHAALALDPVARPVFLSQQCTGNEALRKEVESLLAHDANDISQKLAQFLTAGNLLGPYKLVEPIGEGGMGTVWKALDTRLNRTVAIKTSKVGFADEPQGPELRFRLGGAGDALGLE